MILSIETLAVPHVPAADRVMIDDLGCTDDGITHASARFGYMDQPNVPEVLRQIEEADIESPDRSRRRLLLPLHHRSLSAATHRV